MRLIAKICLTVSAAIAALSFPALAADAVFTAPPLDHGFQLLYNLDFDRAHGIFSQWEKSHPDDPMGPTADAAGVLFSEFDRLGVLESQFFELDKRFENRPKLNSDPAIRQRFDAAIKPAQNISRARWPETSGDK